MYCHHTWAEWACGPCNVTSVVAFQEVEWNEWMRIQTCVLPRKPARILQAAEGCEDFLTFSPPVGKLTWKKHSSITAFLCIPRVCLTAVGNASYEFFIIRPFAQTSEALLSSEVHKVG